MAMHLKSENECGLFALSQQLAKHVRDWMKSFRQYGALGGAAYFFDLVRVQRSEQAENFDLRFCTDTAVAYPWKLPSINDRDASEIHAYQATAVWSFAKSSNPFRYSRSRSRLWIWGPVRGARCSWHLSFHLQRL